MVLKCITTVAAAIHDHTDYRHPGSLIITLLNHSDYSSLTHCGIPHNTITRKSTVYDCIHPMHRVAIMLLQFTWGKHSWTVNALQSRANKNTIEFVVKAELYNAFLGKTHSPNSVKPRWKCEMRHETVQYVYATMHATMGLYIWHVCCKKNDKIVAEIHHYEQK